MDSTILSSVENLATEDTAMVKTGQWQIMLCGNIPIMCTTAAAATAMSCCSRSSKSIHHFAAPASSSADTFDVMFFIFRFAAAANSALNSPSNVQDHNQVLTT
jgi:hypothetical protein